MAAVISYNTSVFSAMGFHGDRVKSSGGVPSLNSEKGFYPSEARFLRRSGLTTSGPSTFFENALIQLAENVRALETKGTPVIMIGIQEFHPPTLQHFKTILQKDYEYVPFTKQITNDAKVLTIFDKSLGGIEQVYEADLGLTVRANGTNVFNPPAPPLPNDGGRPIMIIKTSGGYTLINFHGPNRPRLPADKAVDVAVLLKEALQIHAEAADILSRDPAKIIITCDSNDRRHQINLENPVVIGGYPFSDGRKEEDIPISCCYNHDSTGLDTIDEPSPSASMGSKGEESRYIYSGDYVLALNFIQPVTPVPSDLDGQGASIASDHKLVYAIIPIPAKPMNLNGGKRKSRRKSTLRKLLRKSKARSKSKSRR
jgi:hypothetical protein